MSRALWGAVILTISFGVYVGTARHSIGQTGTSTADVCPTDQKSDTLQEFARKCFDAVGEDVPPSIATLTTTALASRFWRFRKRI
jgi:hypothetical protein